MIKGFSLPGNMFFVYTKMPSILYILSTSVQGAA